MSDVDVLARIEADVERGGWRVSGSVIGDADKVSWYQEMEVWFDLYSGGGWSRLPRAAFRGHVIPEQWQKTFQSSVAPFVGFTADEFMRRGRVQGIFFKDVASPGNQHQINGLTYAGIIEHLLGKSGEEGHCNLVRGIWPEGIITLDINSSSSAVDEYQLREGGFWAKLKEVAQIDQFYLWVGKDNTLHCHPHLMFDASLPTPVFTLDSEWLLEPLDIEPRHTEQVGQVILHGTTPAGLQITGRYPTEPGIGPVVERSGYLATSASKMTDIAEREYKFENRDYTVTARIANGVGLLIDLMDRIQVTYSSTADGVSWSEKKFWIHKITVEILKTFTARTTLQLEAENV